jgi:GNAT superfamily N-acetyltransferase
MAVTERNDGGVTIRPLTPDRWADLERLFGKQGAYGGCWCMWWRLTGAEFRRGTAGPNRTALKAIVDEGRVPGLLAYQDGAPAGWCSVAPRAEFGRLQRSPTLRPLDDEPVWSIVCFYIDPRHRGRGIGAALLRAAVDHAAEHGAHIVEGYPVEPGAGRVSAASAYTGVTAMFEQAGFREAARRGRRPIMRRVVGNG